MTSSTELRDTIANLHKLRNVIAELYSDSSSIQRLIDESGMKRWLINLPDDSPVTMWHKVLDEAEKHECLNTLLDIIQQEYANNSKFNAAYDTYKRSVKEFAILHTESVATKGTYIPADDLSIPLAITKPGFLRYYLDRWFPKLHQKLTDEMGVLPNPPERSAIDNHLRNLRETLTEERYEKKYIQLTGKSVPPARSAVEVKHLILHIHGRMGGGDSISPQIAAASRKSRPVRNILTTLDKSNEPLILLGEPGSGKTMTLKRLAISLIDEELKRVFPRVLLFVRLGEFHVSDEDIKKWEEKGPLTKDEIETRWRDEVLKHVENSTNYLTPELIEGLKGSRRLIIFFDGMDEMSRERYTEHTKALSGFAGLRNAKTLFTCRVADFSPEFRHEKLVLMPFGIKQIIEYLKGYFKDPPVLVDGKYWHYKELAIHILNRNLSVHADNPFVLWLLCEYLNSKEQPTWPSSRMELLQSQVESICKYYFEENDARQQNVGMALPTKDEILTGWGQFAYIITGENGGSSISVSSLTDQYFGEISVEELKEAGKKCRILVVDDKEDKVRFEHHRFQEYFCAVYIERSQPKIKWSDKFDAPRWQEIVLNVILLNNAHNVIQELFSSLEDFRKDYLEQIDSIKKELRRFQQTSEKKKSKSTKDFRRVASCPRPDRTSDLCQVCGANVSLADSIVQQYDSLPETEGKFAERVELASQILRHIDLEKGSTAQANLMSSFRCSVSTLAEHGNPITQVKMMRSCQNVPAVGTIEALCKPLQSPVSWVRNQALTLLAGTNANTQIMGSDLATEIGYDLASGTLPFRLLVYLQSIFSSRRKIDIWALSTGIFCYLIYFASLCGIAIIMFYLPSWLALYPYLNDYLAGFDPSTPLSTLITQPVPIWIYASVGLIVAASMLRIQSHRWWLAIPVGGTVISLLSLIFYALWSNRIIDIVEGIVPLIFTTFFVLLISSWCIALITSMIHFIILSAYLVVTKPLRKSSHPFKGFLLSAWRTSEYSLGFYILIGLFGFSSGFVLIIAGVILLFAILALLIWGAYVGAVRNIEAGNSWINIALLGVFLCASIYVITKKRVVILQALRGIISFVLIISFPFIIVWMLSFVFEWISHLPWWNAIAGHIFQGILIVVLSK